MTEMMTMTSPQENTTTRILLAEDHVMVRAGIRALLESSKMQVVGEASDGLEAVRLAEEVSPELILLDVAMPKLNGIEAAREILALNSDAKIIMLSMHADEQYVYEALRAGVRGYVLKDAAFSELINAIKTVLAGETYLSGALNEVVADDYIRRARGERGPTELEKLSQRERQVLQLITEGHSSAEAAKILHISVRTVESHRLHLMDKLGIRSIAELTKCAIRHGVVSI
jgi:DNA-binding NarL/FixJ family response regulator